MGRLCQAGETGRRLTRVFFDADVVSSLQNVPQRRPRRTLTSREHLRSRHRTRKTCYPKNYVNFTNIYNNEN